MSGLELVRFQKSGDSSFVKISDLGESRTKSDMNVDLGLDLDSNLEAYKDKPGQNFDLNKIGNPGEIFKIARIGRVGRRSKNLTLWCFTFLFLWTVTTSLFSLGFFMGKFGFGKDWANADQEVKAEFESMKVLQEIKSTLAEFRNESLMIKNNDDEDFLPREDFLQYQNQTKNHSAIRHDEIKSKLDFVHKGILERHEAEISKMGSKISSEHKVLVDKFTAQHLHIRQNIAYITNQIIALNDVRTKEMNILREERTKQISTVTEQIKAIFDQIQNQMQSQATNSKVNPSAPSVPRFYRAEQFKESWFAPSPGWEKKCTNMPSNMNNQASSVNLGGHCLLICPASECKPSSGYRKKECLEIHPDTYGLDNFVKLDFNDNVSSFRLCQTPK